MKTGEKKHDTKEGPFKNCRNNFFNLYCAELRNKFLVAHA